MTLNKLMTVGILSMVAFSFYICNTAMVAAEEQALIERHKKIEARSQLREVCSQAWPLKKDRYFDCIHEGFRDEH